MFLNGVREMIRKPNPSASQGSALVACLLVLVVLTTLGVLAIHTSVTETKIAANEQRWEEDFNISEGAAALEASHVGFARSGAFQWYEISDPELLDQFLVPPSNNIFDPGDDITFSENFPAEFLTLSTADQKTETSFWPRQNLRQDIADNIFDYAYLVTYLGTSDKGLKGYDAATFAAYQFRINGVKQTGTARNGLVIEMGGIKIGVKSM